MEISRPPFLYTMKQFIHSTEHVLGVHDLGSSSTLKVIVSEGKKHGNHNVAATVLGEVKKYPSFPNTQAIFRFTDLNRMRILPGSTLRFLPSKNLPVLPIPI